MEQVEQMMMVEMESVVELMMMMEHRVEEQWRTLLHRNHLSEDLLDLDTRKRGLMVILIV